MLYGEEHLLFVVRVIDLLRLDDLFLMKHFDGVKPEVMFAPNCHGERGSDGEETRLTEMDSPEAACPKGTLKVKVGETIGPFCSTLVWKGVIYGTRLIYALASFAAFTGSLCRERTAVLDVWNGEGKTWDGLLLLLWRLLVTMGKVAKFVCHAPDHTKGLEVYVVGGREGGSGMWMRGNKERRRWE